MQVRIQTTNSMSNTTYHKRCSSPGQRKWWLREDGGDFVQIGEHRGDRALDVALELEPGDYILGTGPRSHGRRIPVTVHPDGTVEID